MGFLEAEAEASEHPLWCDTSILTSFRFRDRGPGLRQKNLRYIEKAIL